MSNEKRILIISMTSGFGHVRAGQALLDYAKESLPAVRAEHLDLATLVPSLKKYTKLYDVFSKKMPLIWRMIYRYGSIPMVKSAISLKGLLNRSVKEYIQEKNPDAILVTNIIILPLFGAFLRKMFPKVKIGVVVTDYHGHAYYRFPFVDYYFVPTPGVADDLKKAGIETRKITVTGIPINPKFYLAHNTAALREKYGIKPGMPVVVLVASFRVSEKELLWLVLQLLDARPAIHLICITNANKALYQMLIQEHPQDKRLLVLEWTEAMEEFMKIAEVIISKAGGLTVSECLALKKPLIMVRPIPGQEEHNAEFVEKNHLGRKVDSLKEILPLLPEMILLGTNNQKDLLPDENPCKKILQTMLN